MPQLCKKPYVRVTCIGKDTFINFVLNLTNIWDSQLYLLLLGHVAWELINIFRTTLE